jgi:GDP-mannose pyrophosphatase NudK
MQKIKILAEKILSESWATLKAYTLHYQRSDGRVEEQRREIFYNGHGCCVLLYNPITKKILLVRQFRLVAWINDDQDGMMVECCAGLVEHDDPEATIKKEILEETGYKIEEVDFLFKAYPTPGAKDELIYFYKAAYYESMKANEGGGRVDEQEDIELLELDFEEAWNQYTNGDIIDLKTISLLQYARMDIFKLL